VGGGIGILAGSGAAAALTGLAGGSPAAIRLLGVQAALTILLLALLVTVMAGWIPALAAAREDPADVLRDA